MAFNPDIHMNPNFRFLSPAEFGALDDQDQLNYLFEEMTFLIELDMAGIDPNNVQNPPLEHLPVEQNLPLTSAKLEDEEFDEEVDANLDGDAIHLS
jgi:hypothetical protein